MSQQARQETGGAAATLADWLRRRRIPFCEKAAIAPHLYFRIGGRVRLLVQPRTSADFTAVLQELAGCSLPLLVIGGGSNIVFGDGLTEAAAVLAPPPVRGGVRRLREDAIRVQAGMRNQSLLAWCAQRGLGGLEFLSGIPGTLGGAAAVNAGAFGSSLADFLLDADIVDAGGRRRRAAAADFSFRYRDSRFKMGRETILTLRLRVAPGDCRAIGRRIRENLEYRVKNHPSFRWPSAGCFFKNPVVDGRKRPAGQLIEACGLKNAASGDAAVAAEHANFIVNRGQAAFADLIRLEETIRAAVMARTGIMLEREVIYVSADGRKY